MLQSKSHVIHEAATIIVRLHPNKYDPFNHCELIKVAFEVVCRDVPENDPSAASDRIISYIQKLFVSKER